MPGLEFQDPGMQRGFWAEGTPGEAGQVGAWLAGGDEPETGVEGGPDVGVDHDRGKGQRGQTPAR